jgi:two-component system, chemotaxis family, chemotaxis protein CheY
MHDEKVVLIVDDSPTMRKIISSSLAKLDNFVVLEAGDGLAAVEILEKGDVDLIISDWNMPRMDGLQFVAAVRKSKKHGDVPILMITVNDQRNAVVAAMKAGVNEYIIKPFNQEEFRQKIVGILKPNPRRQPLS